MAPRSNKPSSATISPPPSELVTQHIVQWVSNNGQHHAFEPRPSDATDDDRQEVIDFEVVGTLTRAFLQAGAKNKPSSATISPPPPSKLVPQRIVQWVSNKGRYHAFEPRPSDATNDDRQEIIEFEVVGTLTRAFLQAGAISHTISVDIGHSEIDRIKSIVRTVPNFKERGYRWPFQGTDAKFTSKDNLKDPYEGIWDARDINVHEIDSRAPLTINDLEEGSKIFVEYTISPYSAKKSRPNVEGFEAGTTLQLLSVGLLERPDRKLDFESSRKRRRMAA